jgi:hypothetical protein
MQSARSITPTKLRVRSAPSALYSRRAKGGVLLRGDQCREARHAGVNQAADNVDDRRVRQRQMKWLFGYAEFREQRAEKRFVGMPTADRALMDWLGYLSCTRSTNWTFCLWNARHRSSHLRPRWATRRRWRNCNGPSGGNGRKFIVYTTILSQ